MTNDNMFTPVVLGNTWKKNDSDQYLLPKHSLGWSLLSWVAEYLVDPKTQGPFLLTHEQARFILWMYEIDEDGEYVNRTIVIQRLKGWGKSPLAAVVALYEAFGPSDFSYWDEDGDPVSVEGGSGWVQIVGVAREQTENTMLSIHEILPERTIKELSLEVDKWQVTKKTNRAHRITSVASNPSRLQGGRPRMVVAEEPHEWDGSNGGFDLWTVLSYNASKGGNRIFSPTNAPDPNLPSVGLNLREQMEAENSGQAYATGLYYDSLEAPVDAAIDEPDIISEWLKVLRGDSKWFPIKPNLQEILKITNPISQSRRMFYNQTITSEDRWVDFRDWMECQDKTLQLQPRDEIVMFLDCSKSDDGTALVAVRRSDSAVFVLGYWEPNSRNRRGRGEEVEVDRDLVDAAVTSAFHMYTVKAFWADPSHAKDSVTKSAYWESYINNWHQKYRHLLERTLPALRGVNGNTIMWDMTSVERQKTFIDHLAITEQSILDHELLHNGDERLNLHVRNAKISDTRVGRSIWKGSKSSAHKIDLAVSAVGALMMNRMLDNSQRVKKTRRGGVAGF